MAFYNYKRVYSLVVGLPPTYTVFTVNEGDFLAEVPPQYTVILDDTNLDLDTNNDLAITKRAVSISDLQMKADIQGSDSKSTGGNTTSTIKIYNLSKSQQSLVTAPNSFVILRGGYEFQLGADKDYEALPIIFTGQVISSRVEFEGTDRVTSLSCGDGFTPKSSIKVSLSLPPSQPLYIFDELLIDGTPATFTTSINYKDIFELLIKAWKDNGIFTSDDSINLYLPEPVGDISVIILPLGWSYEGFLADCMDDLCKSFGYTWYITNNTLFIHYKGFNKFVKKFTLEKTQTLDIKPLEDNSRGSDPTSKSSGVTVKTLLDGRFQRGSLIEIPFGSERGTYSISGISYKMDYRGNDWYNEIICEAV